MPRPPKGYTKILYVYVKPENLKAVEKAAKSHENVSKSDVVNVLLDHAREKGLIDKLLEKAAK